MFDRDDLRGIGAHISPSERPTDLKKRVPDVSSSSTTSLALETEDPFALDNRYVKTVHNRYAHTLIQPPRHQSAKPLWIHDHNATNALYDPMGSDTRASSPTLGRTLLPEPSPVSSPGQLSPLQAYLDDEQRAPFALGAVDERPDNLKQTELADMSTSQGPKAQNKPCSSLTASWEHVTASHGVDEKHSVDNSTTDALGCGFTIVNKISPSSMREEHDDMTESVRS